MQLTVLAGAKRTGPVVISASAIQEVWPQEQGCVVQLTFGREWTVEESAAQVRQAQEAEWARGKVMRKMAQKEVAVHDPADED
jgi:hypothetical protein